MVGMLSMHVVPKPIKNRVILLHNKHKKTAKAWSTRSLARCSLKRPKKVHFKDNKERGSWDLKAPSSPLKSLKISVVRRPKHQGLGAHTK